MSETNDSVERLRLEGKAELLEATVVRFRALEVALGSLMWRERLRENLTVLHVVVKSVSEVEEARVRAWGHLEQEAAPKRTPLRRCLELLQQRERHLLQLLQRRVGRKTTTTASGLGELLLLAEKQVLTHTPSALASQKWRLAHALLSARPLEVGRVALLGDFLESVFKRPFDAQGAIALSLQEARALKERLPEGERALSDLWGELSAADASGELVHHLRRRATRAPLRVAQGPVDHLLRTSFWHLMALARARAWTEVRVPFVSIPDEELAAVLLWLVAKGESDTPSPSLLIQLSAALAPVLAGNRGVSLDWSHLHTLAVRCDREGLAEGELLLDAVTLCLRAGGQGRAPSSWSDAVARLRVDFERRPAVH